MSTKTSTKNQALKQGFRPHMQSSHTQWIGVGRAMGGATIFALPLMMTSEIWWLGYYIDPLRLLCLLLVSLPVYVKVSSLIGFTDCKKLLDNVIDVFVAYAFGVLISILALSLFDVIGSNYSVSVNITSVTLLAIPASLGALLGRSELGSGKGSGKGSDEGSDEKDSSSPRSRSDDVAILAVGALFLAFNIVPTEEITQLSHQMTSWQLLALFILTLVVMYVFVGSSRYSSSAGKTDIPKPLSGQICYTGVAFLVALSISVFMLWVFGQTDDLSFTAIVSCAVVLLLPAGVGAAAAHLII